MSRIVAAALLCLLVLLAPVGAEALTQDQAQAIAEWAGFHGQVLVDREVEEPNGVFGVYLGILPVILIDQPAGFPDRWAVLILLHEVGHYMQWRAGYFEDMLSIERELDADLWGLRAACGLGITPMDLHDLWVWMIRRYGDFDSESHGRASARILYSVSNAGEACGRRFEA